MRSAALARQSLIAAVFAAAMVAYATPLASQEGSRSFDDLIAAYPDALARYNTRTLYWRDGTEMPLSDGDDAKPFAQRLSHPSIADQLLLR